VYLESAADDLVIKIYTVAMVVVGSRDAGPSPAGWSTISLPDTLIDNVTNGQYYYRVTAQKGGNAFKPVVGRLVVLR
jgi:hypothetical protein